MESATSHAVYAVGVVERSKHRADEVLKFYRTLDEDAIDEKYNECKDAARATFSMTGTQIENERVFSIAGIITAGRRGRLGMDMLKNYMEIYKNYPDDPLHGFPSYHPDDLLGVISSKDVQDTQRHLSNIASMEAEVVGENRDIDEE